jgi:hypothetical protein
MTKRISIIVSLIFVLVGAGCATEKKVKATHVPPHPHHYPFTEVLDDYHVRLVVDHNSGEMALIFVDISEKAVKVVRVQRIMGKATLPHGRVIEETFRSEKHPGEKYKTRRSRFKKRLAGMFTAQAEWVKTTPKFGLTVLFPFKGTDRQLTFNYEVPGGEIPFHRR